jgi:hypothetical protein
MNGASKQHTGAWVIAFAFGRTLVGQRLRRLDLATAKEVDSNVLAPVFDLVVQVLSEQDPRTGQPTGRQRVNYQAQPILLIGSLDRLELPHDAAFVPVKGCSSERQILEAIVVGEQLQKTIRAASVGLSLAHSLPKVSQ